jgi:hypothetical protein
MAVSINVLLMVPLSIPSSFHIYTPSATPIPKTPFLQQSSIKHKVSRGVPGKPSGSFLHHAVMGHTGVLGFALENPQHLLLDEC